MPVKVTIKRAGVSAEEVEDHPTADTVFVKEGHLHVAKGTKNDDRHIAIYAPDKWVSAKVEE